MIRSRALAEPGVGMSLEVRAAFSQSCTLSPHPPCESSAQYPPNCLSTD